MVLSVRFDRIDYIDLDEYIYLKVYLDSSDDTMLLLTYLLPMVLL